MKLIPGLLVIAVSAAGTVVMGSSQTAVLMRVRPLVEPAMMVLLGTGLWALATLVRKHRSRTK